MRQVYRIAFDFMNMDIPPVLEVYDVLSEYEVCPGSRAIQLRKKGAGSTRIQSSPQWYQNSAKEAWQHFAGEVEKTREYSNQEIETAQRRLVRCGELAKLAAVNAAKPEWAV